MCQLNGSKISELRRCKFIKRKLKNLFYMVEGSSSLHDHDGNFLEGCSKGGWPTSLHSGRKTLPGFIQVEDYTNHGIGKAFLLNKLLKSTTCLYQLFRIDDDGLIL
jgi:hypothetical protein